MRAAALSLLFLHLVLGDLFSQSRKDGTVISAINCIKTNQNDNKDDVCILFTDDHARNRSQYSQTLSLQYAPTPTGQPYVFGMQLGQNEAPIVLVAWFGFFGTGDSLSMLYCADRDCTSYTETLISKSFEYINAASFVLDSHGIPCFSYMGAKDYDPDTNSYLDAFIMAGRCGDPKCGSAKAASVASLPKVGYTETKITLHGDLSVISFLDINATTIVKCQSADCSNVTTEKYPIRYLEDWDLKLVGSNQILTIADQYSALVHSCTNSTCQNTLLYNFTSDYRLGSTVVGNKLYVGVSIHNEFLRDFKYAYWSINYIACSNLECSQFDNITLATGIIPGDVDIGPTSPVTLTPRTINNSTQMMVIYQDIMTNLLYAAVCKSVDCSDFQIKLIDDGSNWIVNLKGLRMVDNNNNNKPSLVVYIGIGVGVGGFCCCFALVIGIIIFRRRRHGYTEIHDHHHDHHGH